MSRGKAVSSVTRNRSREPPPIRRTHANLLLLLAGAIWGMGFVAQSTAMQAVGPLLFVGLRFLIATLVTLPFALLEGRRAAGPVGRSGWTGFLFIGLALFCGMSLQQIGLLTTSVTNSGFLTGLYVVFVPILLLLFARQAPHPVVWPASALAFAGLFLLSGGALVSMRPGDLLTVAAAGFWAVQLILIGRYSVATGRPLLLSATQFAICAALGLGFAVAFEPVAWTSIRAALPEILYAGAVASGLAFSLQAIGQRYTSPALAAILLSTEALFAAFFGALFLGERIGGLGYLGGLFIFAGSWPWRRRLHGSPAVVQANRREAPIMKVLLANPGHLHQSFLRAGKLRMRKVTGKGVPETHQQSSGGPDVRP